MSQITQLLNYQKKDSELLALEEELANSDERKKYLQTQNFLKKASEKLDQLEGKSQELASLFERLTGKYEEIAETLKDYEHIDELVAGGADISFYQRSAQQLTDSLKSLKGEVNNLISVAKETQDEYLALKKKVLAAQKQYPELKNAYQEYKKTRQEAAAKVSAELENIAKDIDEGVLKKYKAKRAERIFPILCEIKSDRCSKCGMELSLADKETVSEGRVVECENCHRFLYKV